MPLISFNKRGSLQLKNNISTPAALVEAPGVDPGSGGEITSLHWPGTPQDPPVRTN